MSPQPTKESIQEKRWINIHRLRSWHARLGWIAGILFLIAGITGSAIVFHHELDTLIEWSRWHVQPADQRASLDQLIQSFASDHPDLHLQSIRWPGTADETIVLEAERNPDELLQRFVNPYTAVNLGERIYQHSMVGRIYRLHYQLGLGLPGLFIMMVVGILMIGSASSGLLMWSGWKRLQAGFKIRSTKPPGLRAYDLHKVGGILSGGWLVLLAATGIVILLLHVPSSIAALKPRPPAPIAQVEPSDSRPDLEQLLKDGHEAMPDAKIRYLRFNPEAPDELTLEMQLPEQTTGRFNLSSIRMDQRTGTILAVDRRPHASGSLAVILLIGSLHFGSFSGLSSQLFYVVLGLTPLFLLLTGATYWWHRKPVINATKPRVQ